MLWKEGLVDGAEIEGGSGGTNRERTTWVGTEWTDSPSYLF